MTHATSRARSCARQRSSGSAACAHCAARRSRLDHRLLPHCEARARISERIFRRGRGVRRHLRRPRRREAERAPISSEYAIRRSCLHARASIASDDAGSSSATVSVSSVGSEPRSPPSSAYLATGWRGVTPFASFALHVQRRTQQPHSPADRRIHVGLQARGRARAQLAELALRQAREPRAVGAEEAVGVLHFLACDIVMSFRGSRSVFSSISSSASCAAAAIFARRKRNRTAPSSRRIAPAMLAARHNVESPVVSPQKAVDRGRGLGCGGVAKPRGRLRVATLRAADAVEQLRAAGVGSPSSAVAQDVVVRMRARAWHHLQRAVLGWRKRSLLQACAMWRAWTMQLMAGVALLTCRAEVAAAQRGATRGVQSAEAHARARCDALQREVDRLRGQLAAAARKAQLARDEAAAAHDDAEQARETRRRATWSRARRRRRARRRSGRCARRRTRSAASSTSRTSSAAAPSASRSLPPSRAAKSSPRWRRSQSGGGRCCSCSSA